jgi:hypothetical protein
MLYKRPIVCITVLAILFAGATGSSIRLLSSYTCTPGTLETIINLNTALVVGVDWTVGFWIKVRMDVGVDQTFLKLKSTLDPNPQVFKIKTEDIQNFGLYVDGVLNFKFLGSSVLDDPGFDYIRRENGNNWNYFTFAFKKLALSVQITRSLNDNEGFVDSSLTLYRPETSRITIGNVNGPATCDVQFIIHALDLLDGAYNSPSSGNYRTKSLFSLGSGSYICLYKLNFSPFARNFLNLLDTSKLKATLHNSVKAKTSFPFPLYGDQLDRFTFGGAQTKVVYDSGTVPKSPTNNSYTFFLNFKAFGTNVFAYQCPSHDTCSVPDFDFGIYKRIEPTRTSSYLSVLKTWSFKDLTQCLTMKVESIKYQLELQPITMPITPIEFVLTPTSFVYLLVEEQILASNAKVKLCFGATQRACSGSYSLTIALKSDDVHLSSFSIQPISNYMYIFVGEIAFIDTTTFEYDNLANSLKTDNPSGLIIFESNKLDLKRIANNSFLSLNFQSTMDVGLYNCFSVMQHCGYCENNVCKECMTNFYMQNGLCVSNYNNLYNPILDTANMGYIYFYLYDIGSTVYDILSNMISQMESKVFVLSISFMVKKNLSNAFDENEHIAPEKINNYDQYFSYINTLESSNYQPDIMKEYNPKDEATNSEHFMRNYANLLINIKKFLISREHRISITTFPVDSWKLRSNIGKLEDNLCFSDQLKYRVIPPLMPPCELYCPRSSFFDKNSNVCAPCTADCAYCNSADYCLICAPHFQLNSYLKCEAYTPTKNYNYIAIAAAPYKDSVDSSSSSLYCPLGFRNDRNVCHSCPKNCLRCATSYRCVRCESNFYLNNDFLCVNSTVITKATNSTANGTDWCESCFQVQNTISAGCGKCNNICRCSFYEYRSQNTYLFSCFDVQFSSNSVASKQDVYFFYQNMTDSSTFVVASKSNIKTKHFTLDVGLVLNTTNCYIGTNLEYTLVEKVSLITSLQEVVHSSLDKISLSSIDMLILTLSLFGGPVGNVMIGLLQFNKTYLFISLSNVSSGIINRFLNENLYLRKKPETGFFVPTDSYYQYMSVYYNEFGIFMISKFILFMFMSMIIIGQVMISVAKCIKCGNNNENEAYSNIETQLKFYGYSIQNTVSYRYYNILIISLSFELSNISFIESPINATLYISMLLTLLYLSTSVYNKIVSFLQTSEPGKHDYFNILVAPRYSSLSKNFLKNRIFDEFFNTFKAFGMYHLRKYKDFFVVFSLCVTVGEFIGVLCIYKRYNKGIAVVKAIGVGIMGLFCFILILKHFGVGIDDQYFDTCYLLSNLCRMAEVTYTSVFTYQKNEAYKRSLVQVKPLKYIITE